MRSSLCFRPESCDVPPNRSDIKSTRSAVFPTLLLHRQLDQPLVFFTTSLSPTTSAMFARSAVRALTRSRQFSSSAARQTKVAVLGAGGGIGQPLSLLLKKDPLVTSLSLYDIRGAPGVATDVSHIDTASEVRYVGNPPAWCALTRYSGPWLPCRQA